MKTCSKCNIQFDDSKKFCTRCGSPLVSEQTIDAESDDNKEQINDLQPASKLKSDQSGKAWTIIRWIAFIPAAIGGYIISVVLSNIVSFNIESKLMPHGDYRIIIDVFRICLATIISIIVGSFVAPPAKKKNAVIIICLLYFIALVGTVFYSGAIQILYVVAILVSSMATIAIIYFIETKKQNAAKQ